MAVQAFFVLDQAQETAAEALNTPEAMVIGVPINNPLANQLGLGTLVGKFFVPALLMNDPAYTGFYEFFESYQIHTLESELLVLPVII